MNQIPFVLFAAIDQQIARGARKGRLDGATVYFDRQIIRQDWLTPGSAGCEDVEDNLKEAATQRGRKLTTAA